MTRYLKVMGLIALFLLAACSPGSVAPSKITPAPAVDSNTSREMLDEFMKEQSRMKQENLAHVTILVENNACVVILDGDYSTPHKARDNMSHITVSTTSENVEGYVHHVFTTICGDVIYNRRDEQWSGYFYTYDSKSGELIHFTNDVQNIFTYRTWYLWTIERDTEDEKVPN